MTHSFAQTLYQLVLGARDSVTGQPQRGYVITTVEMAIFSKGAPYNYLGHSYFAGRNAQGHTKGDVSEGDIIKDSIGKYYLVVSVQADTWGTTFVQSIVGLKEILDIDFRIPTSGSSPSSDPSFFGFEDSGDTQKFEDGFERGYFV